MPGCLLHSIHLSVRHSPILVYVHISRTCIFSHINTKISIHLFYFDQRIKEKTLSPLNHPRPSLFFFSRANKVTTLYICMGETEHALHMAIERLDIFIIGISNF